jgi:hypothetical protein
VQALVPFVARINGDTLPVQAGELIDMPPGVDWLSAGLVALAPASEIELATAEPVVEHAVMARPRRRKAGQ